MIYRVIGIARRKKVQLSPHAVERAETRRITEGEILCVLNDNLINVPGKYGTRKVFGAVKERRIVVYVEEYAKEIVVSTVAAPEER